MTEPEEPPAENPLPGGEPEPEDPPVEEPPGEDPPAGDPSSGGEPEPEDPPGEEPPTEEPPAEEPPAEPVEPPVMTRDEIETCLRDCAATPAEAIAVTVLSPLLNNTQVCGLLIDRDVDGRPTGVRWQDVDTVLAEDGPLSGRLHCTLEARLRAAAAIAVGTPLELPVTGLDRETVGEIVSAGVAAEVPVRFVDPTAAQD